MKIAVLNIATGRYIDLFERSKQHISDNFLTSHNVDLFLFTDSDREFSDDRINIKKYFIKKRGYPGDTLFRYHYFLLAEKELLKYDYVYYIDVDMNVVSPVGEEIFGDLVATLHPGYYNRSGATFENRLESTAYVDPSDTGPYFCGGFQGGSPEFYLNASREISNNINMDGKKNIIALWHDESHWNSFLRKQKPTLTLNPEFCYPQENYSWLKQFKDTKKIVCLIKDEKNLREKMTHEEEYKRFLKGKKVAIVGPAKSVMFQKNGALIDSYDVVVRICNTEADFDLSHHSEYIGTKTDVIYNVMDSNIPNLKKWVVDNRVRYLSTTYPSQEWFFGRMKNNVELLRRENAFKTVVIPPEPYFLVKKATNSRPNSGFCAIIDLLSSELKELFITGIDFYRSSVEGDGSGYLSNYKIQWSNKKGSDFLIENIDRDGPDIHNPDSAFVFFKKEMFLKDKRIKVDDTFLRYLTDEKYESLYNFFNSEIKDA